MGENKVWSNPPSYESLNEPSAPIQPQYQAPQMQPVQILQPQPVYIQQQPCESLIS